MKPLLSLLFFLAATVSMAQTPKQLYRQYKKCKGAGSVFIPRLVIKVAGTIAAKEAEDEDDRRSAKLIKHVHSMRLLALEDCQADDIKSFQKAANALNRKGYETLVSVKEDDEKSLILIKMKKDRVRELVLLNVDNEEAALILVNCNISPDLVQELADEVQAYSK